MFLSCKIHVLTLSITSDLLRSLDMSQLESNPELLASLANVGLHISPPATLPPAPSQARPPPHQPVEMGDHFHEDVFQSDGPDEYLPLQSKRHSLTLD
jgi:hypothetical protein